jgi:hypothetical protein
VNFALQKQLLMLYQQQVQETQVADIFHAENHPSSEIIAK